MAIVVGPTSWQFNVRTPLGSSFGGGRVICKSGGVAWVVAPNTSEVSRSWYCRNDAITTAQSVSGGCTGWFIPTCGQLQNPGFVCRTYWDSYSTSPFYWSDTSWSPYAAFQICLTTGGAYLGGQGHKGFARFVRAFRCVTY